MYYTEKVLRYRVYTQDKIAEDKDVWSLYYSSNDLLDADKVKCSFDNDELRIARLYDNGCESTIQRSMLF